MIIEWIMAPIGNLGYWRIQTKDKEIRISIEPYSGLFVVTEYTKQGIDIDLWAYRSRDEAIVEAARRLS